MFTRGCYLSPSWARSVHSIAPYSISWRSSLQLPFHLCIGLASGVIPSGFPTKTLCTSKVKNMLTIKKWKFVGQNWELWENKYVYKIFTVFCVLTNDVSNIRLLLAYGMFVMYTLSVITSALSSTCLYHRTSTSGWMIPHVSQSSHLQVTHPPILLVLKSMTL
jgi:hypothetical protein